MPVRNRVRRVVICLLLVPSLLSLQGCSLFVSRQQAVTIRATDPDADIIVDDIPRGTGSVALRLDRRRSHTVVARAPGGQTGAAAINKKVSATGVLDIVGGVFFLFPFLGLLGAGFWELDPEDVTVHVH